MKESIFRVFILITCIPDILSNSPSKIGFYAENNVYQVRIELNGNHPVVFVNGTRLTPNGTIRFAERNLFLGYMTVAGPEIAIAAGISDLVIKNK